MNINNLSNATKMRKISTRPLADQIVGVVFIKKNQTMIPNRRTLWNTETNLNTFRRYVYIRDVLK